MFQSKSALRMQKDSRMPSASPPESTGSSLRPSHIIRIAIYADPHGRRYTQKVQDADLVLLAGDFSYQPLYQGCRPFTGVQDQIDDLNHFKDMYADNDTVIVAIPGNHDWPVQTAFERCSDPTHPALSKPSTIPWGRTSVHISDHDCRRIREAYKSSNDGKYYFSQHGLLDTKVKNNPLSLFCSGASQRRGTDGYAFDEEDGEALWDEMQPGVDIVMTHGPMACSMRDIRHQGETRIDMGYEASQSLRTALLRSKPVLAVCGHHHNGYGHMRVTYDNEGSDTARTGLFVNAAAVIDGTKPKMRLPDNRVAEYLSPRDPYVVDFNTITKECTVVSNWNDHGSVRGEKVTIPDYKEIIAWDEEGQKEGSVGGSKAEVTEVEVDPEEDARLLEAYLSTRKFPMTDASKEAWLDSCLKDWNTQSAIQREAGLGGLRGWSTDGTWVRV